MLLWKFNALDDMWLRIWSNKSVYWSWFIRWSIFNFLKYMLRIKTFIKHSLKSQNILTLLIQCNIKNESINMRSSQCWTKYKSKQIKTFDLSVSISSSRSQYQQKHSSNSERTRLLFKRFIKQKSWTISRIRKRTSLFFVNF